MSGDATAAGESDEISLLDLALVLAKHRRLVLGLPLAAALVAAAISLVVTPIYTGTARILPPQQSQSTAAAMLGQLGAVAGLAGAGLGIKNPNDLYVGMLKSRGIADRLIERFRLREAYDADTMDDARKALGKRTTVTSGKDGIITIEAEDEDPKKAAAMANAYVEELDRLNDRLAVTEASQRRLFFEKQLKASKDALAGAEVELRRTQEKTGLIKLDEQGKAIIEAVARLRAEIASREVQLGAMRTFATERNPEYVRLRQELSGMREQLGRLEKSSSTAEGDILVPTGKVPEAGLEYVRRLREVKYQEAMFELVAKQYELARLDEAKDVSIIQSLDRAVAPERRTRPKRALITVLSAVVALFVAVLAAFVLEALEKARRDPEGAARIAALRAAFGLRRG
ncbi:MAG: Wzz/FepE/Etk N-terminal domain-containing protein [Rhodocyclaceae bacterium]